MISVLTMLVVRVVHFPCKLNTICIDMIVRVLVLVLVRPIVVALIIAGDFFVWKTPRPCF
jgi:hypothetical protein